MPTSKEYWDDVSGVCYTRIEEDLTLRAIRTVHGFLRFYAIADYPAPANVEKQTDFLCCVAVNLALYCGSLNGLLKHNPSVPRRTDSHHFYDGEKLLVD